MAIQLDENESLQRRTRSVITLEALREQTTIAWLSAATNDDFAMTTSVQIFHFSSKKREMVGCRCFLVQIWFLRVST